MMDLATLLDTLTKLPLAEFVRTSPWAYPVLETFHVVGLGLLFGGIFAIDLRLLGFHRQLAIDRLAAHILPWVWFGFALNIMSGAMLFMSDAVTFGVNIAFRIKMVLIALAGLNALWFQVRLYPHLTSAEPDASTSRSIKISAVLSLLLWIGIITAGRMIAYSP